MGELSSHFIIQTEKCDIYVLMHDTHISECDVLHACFVFQNFMDLVGELLRWIPAVLAQDVGNQGKPSPAAVCKYVKAHLQYYNELNYNALVIDLVVDSSVILCLTVHF